MTGKRKMLLNMKISLLNYIELLSAYKASFSILRIELNSIINIHLASWSEHSFFKVIEFRGSIVVLGKDVLFVCLIDNRPFEGIGYVDFLLLVNFFLDLLGRIEHGLNNGVHSSNYRFNISLHVVRWVNILVISKVLFTSLQVFDSTNSSPLEWKTDMIWILFRVLTIISWVVLSSPFLEFFLILCWDFLTKLSLVVFSSLLKIVHVDLSLLQGSDLDILSSVWVKLHQITENFNITIHCEAGKVFFLTRAESDRLGIWSIWRSLKSNKSLDIECSIIISINAVFWQDHEHVIFFGKTVSTASSDQNDWFKFMASIYKLLILLVLPSKQVHYEIISEALLPWT